MIQNILVTVAVMVALIGLLYWFRGAFRDKGCSSCSSGSCEACEQQIQSEKKEEKKDT
ncbi:MAG: hypothetical protein ACOC41_00495 [Chitinivibrionales bacterium]